MQLAQVIQLAKELLPMTYNTVDMFLSGKGRIKNKFKN